METKRGRVKINAISEDDVIKDTWVNIAIILEKSNKIYGRDDDRYAFQSESALRFIQEITNNNFLNAIEYERDEIFKLEEWKNDNENELDIEAEILNIIDVWELLNKDFSNDERQKIEELDVSDKNLIGELDLSELPNLKRLDCSHNQLTSLELGTNSNLLYLDCSHNQLRRGLDLTNNKRLISLDCSFNKLEKLTIDNCPDLEMFICNDNELKNNLKKDLLDNFSSKLVFVNISDNNLWGNLADFEKFSNLKLLWIGSEDESKIKRGIFNNIYNRFRGSLESLKDMTKLESLNISNTDINVYSNCLPINIEIWFSTEERPNSKLGEIREKLRESYKDSSQLTRLEEELEVLKREIEKNEEMQELIEMPFDHKM